MKLIDLLPYVTDFCDVKLYENGGDILEEYNGKDSLTGKYNDCSVVFIHAVNGKHKGILEIGINVEAEEE